MALEDCPLQVPCYLSGQIFAFGVRDFTAIKYSNHFAWGNGITQPLVHLRDCALRPSWHACDPGRIKGDRAGHRKHPRENPFFNGGDLDLLRLDLIRQHSN
jgi:hypothetical protein